MNVKNCVLNNHRIHIPDGESDDLYLCHICFKPGRDSESGSDHRSLHESTNCNSEAEDDFMSGENEENIYETNTLLTNINQEDGKENSEDERDTDQLFQLFTSEHKKLGF